MRFNQYSYRKTNPDTMRQELAELGFIYEPQLSDKDNLQSFLQRCFFLYQDRDYLLRAWAADSETDLLTFFESDRELTAEVFYMTAFQLLDFVPFVDFTDLEKFRTESNFPIVYGDLLENLYQLLNTRTKNGNLLVDKLVSEGLIPEDNTPTTSPVRAWQPFPAMMPFVRWFMWNHAWILMEMACQIWSKLALSVLVTKGKSLLS